MRKFKIENLPAKVRERISQVEFADDLRDDCVALVWLNDKYEFDDGSHVIAISNRQELIEEVMMAKCV